MLFDRIDVFNDHIDVKIKTNPVFPNNQGKQDIVHSMATFDNNDTVSNGFIWFHPKMKP